MTNEYNPDGKEIRFIDSHYKDLFHIPDGSCVQIHYSSMKVQGFMKLFDTSKPFYSILYFLLIIGFSYFYATMQFNPIEVANNLKKNGGFIPGFRPGKPTADFIRKVINKVTLFGAIYLGTTIYLL